MTHTPVGSRIIAIDPGLGSFGAALIDLPGDGFDRAARPGVIAVAYNETKKAAKKQNLLAADDTAERARELWQFLRIFWHDAYPSAMPPTRPRALLAEAQSWPRNAGASAKVGVAWGVIVAFAAERDLPILQLSPQKVKKHLCNSISASKEEVEAAVRGRTLWAAEARAYMEGLKGGAHEHVHDAIAVGLCAYQHPGWALTGRV